MSAGSIAHALGGHKLGRGWVARCPAHDDHTPSLSINDAGDGKVLVHCHAGCDQERVIQRLQSRGLWTTKSYSSTVLPSESVKRGPDQNNRIRAIPALALWKSAQPARGSLVESYLASRGIHLPPPDSLRFHAGLKHPSGGVWPAMIALVTGVNGAPVAIHRTFLTRDGSAKAPHEPQKMMLGPCRGGALRLGSGTDSLMIGEGIETCLAAILATGHSAWAALSTSGLRSLDLPNNAFNVIVLADGDEAGESAARDSATRWKREGRHVRIARAPWGMDFNDMLMCRAPRHKAAAI